MIYNRSVCVCADSCFVCQIVAKNVFDYFLCVPRERERGRGTHPLAHFAQCSAGNECDCVCVQMN